VTPEELATSWVPVPLRWRHVIAGDTFVDRNGALWHVTRVGMTADGFAAVAAQADAVTGSPVDPDDVIPVLIPVSERDAVELTRDQLGARLVERRTLPLPSEAK
jgi:hypothetical protein